MSGWPPAQALLLLGVPGAGKTSVARLMMQRYNVTHFAASAVLRSHADVCAAHRSGWARSWARGENAPDEEVLPVLWKAFNATLTQVAILDGYPRTVRQLQDFTARGGRIHATIVLDLDDRAAMRRVEQRAGQETRKDSAPEIAERRIARERKVIGDLSGHPFVRRNLVQIDVTQALPDDVVDMLADRLPILNDPNSGFEESPFLPTKAECGW